jgi:hypothetical protein
VWSLGDVIKARYFKLFLGLIGGKRNIVALLLAASAAAAVARKKKDQFYGADTREEENWLCVCINFYLGL